MFCLPEFQNGPAPYALGVHPKTGDVWLNENMTDRFFRFIPEEERFAVYPAPLTGTYTRDFSFTKDGKACTSNNPLPMAALEGGIGEILCIEIMEELPDLLLKTDHYENSSKTIYFSRRRIQLFCYLHNARWRPFTPIGAASISSLR